MTGYINVSEEPVQLYEVIRIIGGIPIFLSDHLERLYQSARLSGNLQLPCPESVTALITNFLASSKRNTGNIKLSFTFLQRTIEPKCELNFIPHYYPTNEEYTNGGKSGASKSRSPSSKCKNPEFGNQRLCKSPDRFRKSFRSTAG